MQAGKSPDEETRTNVGVALMKPKMLAVFLLLVGMCWFGTIPDGMSQSSAPPTYNQLVSTGYDLLKEGKLKEAYIAAVEAAKADDKRFEAYALAALVLHAQGSRGVLGSPAGIRSWIIGEAIPT